MSTPPKATKHHNSTKNFILLPFRAIQFRPFQYDTPCRTFKIRFQIGNSIIIKFRTWSIDRQGIKHSQYDMKLDILVKNIFYHQQLGTIRQFWVVNTNSCQVCHLVLSNLLLLDSLAYFVLNSEGFFFFALVVFRYWCTCNKSKIRKVYFKVEKKSSCD